MENNSQLPDANYDAIYKDIEKLRAAISSVFLGQEQVVDEVLTALLSQGHVLIEGVPGLGKTFLVKTLSKLFSAQFSRIQFTPDLMPADVTGHMIYDKNSGEFITHKGPVFTNFLLADEINRASAKTQAALLEVMEEKQVTLGGEAHSTPNPLMVLATQNPIEQEGTYPLPEAQLDRFLLKILIDYPSAETELKMLEMKSRGESFSRVQPVFNVTSLSALQAALDQVTIDSSIHKYIIDIVTLTRNWRTLSVGAGPRGGIALMKCARAAALLNHRDYVIPDDVKSIAHAVLRHRIILSPEYELAGETTDRVITAILDSVEAPRS